VVGATAAGRASGPDDAPRAVSIGAVLELLRQEFPDISISKIRYLEDQGLVEPLRTAAGYRKFTPAHVERLRYVLAVQRDHYMPLRVIRDHLDALDRGLEVPVRPVVEADAAPRLVEIVPDPQPSSGRFEASCPEEPLPHHSQRPPSFSGPLRYSRAQLLHAAQIDEGMLADLQSHGLVAARPGGHFDVEAVAVARAAGGLADFGIEPRHLRSFRTAADREAGLIEQVTSPLRRRGEGGGAQAEETARELSGLCAALHAALVRAALERGQN